MADSMSEQLDRIRQLEAALGKPERRGESNADEMSPLRSYLAQLDAEAVKKRSVEVAVLSSYGPVKQCEDKGSRLTIVQPNSGIVLTTPFLHPQHRKRSKPEVVSSRPSFALSPLFTENCKVDFKMPTVGVTNAAVSPAREHRRTAEISGGSSNTQFRNDAQAVRIKHLREREGQVEERAASLRRKEAALRRAGTHFDPN